MSHLHKDCLGWTVEALDSDDYFDQADKVLNGTTFKRYPGSRQRLLGPAAAYKQALADWESSGTLEKLGNLASAHQQFAEAFVPEFLRAARHTSPVIAMERPKTLRLFSDVFFSELGRDYVNWKEKISTDDPSFIQQIPALAIFSLLLKPNQDPPEIFSEETLDALRGSFSFLTDDEIEALYQKLKGDEVPLSENAQALFEAIGKCAYDAQRGAAAQEFNAIARTLSVEWKKAIAIIEEMEVSYLPESTKQSIEWILLALLKMESLTDDMLPKDFYPAADEILKLKEFSPESEEWADRLAQCSLNLLGRCRTFNPNAVVRAAFFR
jgi:hypothetical protein